MTPEPSGLDGFTTSGLEPYMGSVSLLLAPTPPNNVGVLGGDGAPDYYTDARAYECILSYCVNIISASTSLGVYREEVIQTHFSDVKSNFSHLLSSTTTIPQDWNPNLNSTSISMNRTFTVEGTAGYLMGFSYTKLLVGMASHQDPWGSTTPSAKQSTNTDWRQCQKRTPISPPPSRTTCEFTQTTTLCSVKPSLTRHMCTSGVHGSCYPRLACLGL